MRRSDIIQELVNTFPSWSKVRNDEQSVGQLALNAFGLPLEKMEKTLARMKANQFIVTANLDEIDLVHRVKLDTDFYFDEDTTDPLFTNNVAPVVSGLQDSTWYLVEAAEPNDIEHFWYLSTPNRATLDSVVSGEDFVLATLEAQDAPVTGLYDHHLGGGKVWVETTGGTQYLNFEDGNLFRGKVILKGKTRKGTTEEETLIFPWDMKQASQKEWTQIREIHAFDIEAEVDLEIRSADFNSGPYISFWNLKYSENRNKIDEFWDIGHNGSIPTMDRLQYQTDEWQQLAIGFSTKDIIDRWELLDTNGNTVSGVDMSVQPFTDRAWIVTADNHIIAYDLQWDTVSGFSELRDATPGANIQIDTDNIHVLLGEDIEFVPWHAKPDKEIIDYRIWYQQPDGQKFGLSGGSPVSYTSDFSVKIPYGTQITRTVEDYITITTTQRGEYMVVFEATFIDGETQEVRKIFDVRWKEPLVELDLSTIIPSTIDGIDFDADQKMWVKSGNDYYQIGLHTDIMLIDYTNRIIYFKEDYEEVEIKTNG